MKHLQCSTLLILNSTVIIMLAGCGAAPKQAPAHPKEAPAKVEVKHAGEESLATITLTEKAEQRLGIKTAAAAMASAPRYYTVAGEVVVPPGQAITVTAPVAGAVVIEEGIPPAGQRLTGGHPVLKISPLLPVPRDLRTNAAADVEAALTRLETARLRLGRAEKLLSDGVGSARAREDAAEAVSIAETDVTAARARLKQIETAPLEGDITVGVDAPQSGVLRQMFVAAGQVVSAGSPLFEIARLDPVWVRTPVYAGDLDEVRKGGSAVVRPISGSPSGEGRSASPVNAPPTADPLSSATHLYYRLPNASLSLHPGEKLSVSVPMKGERECLQLPYAAILYDVLGGAWVYEETANRQFARRRVMVDYVTGANACLAEGPPPGTKVVTDGAAELFGEEFGVGH